MIWSIGNEIAEQYNHADSAGSVIARELASIVRQLDSTRPIITANNDPSSDNPIIKSGALDLIGYNYAHGIYERFHQDYPEKKYDVVISLEPLNTRECNFINSVAEGGEIVQAVNHENFKLLADIYHMLMENESPSNITKYGHLLYHTHIAEKTGRSAPGVNKEDFTPYFKALKDAKYEGRMAIECSWKNLADQAANALNEMRSQLGTI